MGKVEMIQAVILALCFFALVGCGSNTNTKRNRNFIQNSDPQFTEMTAALSKIPPLSRSKRQIIQAEEKVKKSIEIHISDSDSDDYDVVENDPDFENDGPTLENGTRVDQSGLISYQLSIQFQKKDGIGHWLHICSAVILDERTALTAARCFAKSRDVRQFRVVAGENALDIPEGKKQVLQVQKIILHPEYTDFRNGSDIAILHLEEILLNKYARGVWLSPFHNREIADMTAMISGWRHLSNTRSAAVSNLLQKRSVTILSAKECHSRLERQNVSAPGILCALELNPETRTCGGDPGGPLVIQNYKLGNSIGNLLVGLVSSGAGKCDIKNSVGFFTEISHFYDWIQEERAEKPCEENHSPCISGGCYHLDLKCDKDEDCPDGTDEINCGQNNQTTNRNPAMVTNSTVTMEILSSTNSINSTTQSTFPKSSTATPTITPTTTTKEQPELDVLTSCRVALTTLPLTSQRKQWIRPYRNGNGTSLEVLCDFETDGGGWTIIQKRTSGPKPEFNQTFDDYNFDRTWDDYVNGFGSLDENGNFWLGLENIHALTQNGDQELRIELEDFEGEKRWAKYSSFSISNASDFYRLTISGFSTDSTAGDSMTAGSSWEVNNGMQFTTRGDDNDKNLYVNCAEAYQGGGWWFNDCSWSILNGAYRGKEETFESGQGIIWYSWKGNRHSLAKTEIKLRKRFPK